MRILRSSFFAPALATLLLAFAFRVDDGNLSWFWSEAKVVPVVLLAMSLVFWAFVAKDAGCWGGDHE